MHIVKQTLLITASFSLLTGCATVTAEVNIGHKIGEGDQALSGRQLDQASQRFDEALEMINTADTNKTIPKETADYSRALAFTGKARVCVKQNKSDDAVENFEKAKTLIENQKVLISQSRKICAASLRDYASLARERKENEKASKLEAEADKLEKDES